jgi:mannose-6-phosphate isomerase-like protein (cupin superfamily)
VVVPALGTLTRIAAVLKVKVATLMEADDSNGTVMTINPFADPSRFVMTVLGYSIFSPAAGKMDKRMQPIMICARKGEVKRHLVSHQGDEFLFIFEGEMNFKVGEETHLLRKGDSLYFDALQKHGIVSVPNEVEYLDLFVGHQYTAPTQGGEEIVD